MTLVRSLHDGLLRRGEAAVSVQWCDSTVVHATTGEQLYANRGLTKHRRTADNVVAVAQSGRRRGQIANETQHVLKTTGYHLEHNFGPGTQYLSAFLLRLTLLACLFHTVREWSEEQSALLRRVRARRQTFFHDIQALTRYRVFDSWEHLRHFMIRGLELESQVDTS